MQFYREHNAVKVKRAAIASNVESEGGECVPMHRNGTFLFLWKSKAKQNKESSVDLHAATVAKRSRSQLHGLARDW